MSVGTWLMAEGYAELEMRQQPPAPVAGDREVSLNEPKHVVHDRRRRPR